PPPPRREPPIRGGAVPRVVPFPRSAVRQAERKGRCRRPGGVRVGPAGCGPDINTARPLPQGHSTTADLRRQRAPTAHDPVARVRRPSSFVRRALPLGG